MYPERFQLRPYLWWLSFFSQQWKHPTSSLFLKCLVNIFTLATTYKFVYRPCGVMVSTLDFESSDPSSSLGRTSFALRLEETSSMFGDFINLLYAIVTFSIQLMYPERFKLQLATTYKFVYRPCGVMVSTLDFESSDPSSSLGRTCFCIEAQRDILHVWRLVHPSIFFTQSLLSPFN